MSKYEQISGFNADSVHTTVLSQAKWVCLCGVVVHGGVGLPSLPRHKLTKDSGLTAVTDSSNEDI